jgi:CRP-like cAMP-binding protein
VTLGRGAIVVKQPAAGGELVLLLEGSLAVEVDGDRVGEVGPGAILGELAVLEHDLVVVGVVPARMLAE